MKKLISLLLALSLLWIAAGCTQYHARGAGVGGAVGGVAGALLDSKNPWRGGVIGAVLGAIAGATLTEVSMQATQEAVQQNKPVEYRTADGRGVVEAYPLDYDARTKCHKVQERVWEDGKLVKDQIKEVCEGEKSEKKY
ncbi:MAG: glycine zipper 2TM domain-containing protein [Nitrospirae bacterium]|nr:glycine zipper 2TM domain-containing protein [Nitrospirota bacterium]